MFAAVSYSAVVFYCSLIFYLSSKPLHLPGLPRFSDKVIHVIEYGILGALSAAALCTTPFQRRVRTGMLTAGVFSGLYGFSDEFHQWFVPGRQASLADALADTVGAFAGAWLVSRAFLTKGAT